MEIITVGTGTNTPSYDVIVGVGALANLGELVSAAAPAHRYIIIADDQVAGFWGVDALAALERAGLSCDLLTFASGEAHKTRSTWIQLTDQMLALGAGRDTVVIALGGGVTGDVAGFVAATYMRGLRCVQVPTSLLAMIDASIGGKTGVDVPAGKNLVGAFLQPQLVVVDPATLSTLAPAELVNGMAEAVKHGAIADRSYFDWLASESVLTTDGSRLRLIRDSIRIKASFVAADVFESGPRSALNFGHTIAHALELASDYALPHGHAVSIGMIAEATLGERLGATAKGTAAALTDLLERYGLSTRPAADSGALGPATRLDKKARAGRARFVLLGEIGAVARGPRGEWTFDVPSEAVAEVLADLQQA